MKQRKILILLSTVWLFVAAVYMLLLDKPDYAYPGFGAVMFAGASLATFAFIFNNKNKVLYNLAGAVTVSALCTRAMLSAYNIATGSNNSVDSLFQSAASLTLNLCLIFMYMSFWHNFIQNTAEEDFNQK